MLRICGVPISDPACVGVIWDAEGVPMAAAAGVWPFSTVGGTDPGPACVGVSWAVDGVLATVVVVACAGVCPLRAVGGPDTDPNPACVGVGSAVDGTLPFARAAGVCCALATVGGAIVGTAALSGGPVAGGRLWYGVEGPDMTAAEFPGVVGGSDVLGSLGLWCAGWRRGGKGDDES